MRRVVALSAGLLLGIIATSALAEWKEPADGKLSEKQVVSYIEIVKEQTQVLKSAGKAMEGNKSSAAGMAVMVRASEKVKAVIASNGMTEEEFNWVGSKVGDLWVPAMYQLQWDEHGKPDMEKQITVKETEIADLKTKLAGYEQAQKDGKRVLSKEQRDQAVQQASGDRDSIAADIKERTDAMKAINEEVAKHDQEAKDAEALANHPPADVSQDDKAGYIDGKKNEAQTAHDAAKESRERLAQAQKDLDEAKAKLAVAESRIKSPDVPTTDDDKASMKQDNERAIADLKQKIIDNEGAVTTLKETIAAGPMNLFQDEKKKPDPDNMALMKKHVKEWMLAVGMDPSKGM